ncbi:MAG: class I SAM-dependent methyltransferase [bacterium]|nr:class I SAM-dependent methyltransferase [bacterium]
MENSNETEKMNWGDEPEFHGPRDYFRNSLMVYEVTKRKKSGTVLDFGSGSGNLLLRLARSGYQTTGIDASDLAVTFLENKIKESNLHQAQVKKGDDKELSLLSEKFDILVSGETIEHVEDDRGLIKKWFDVLNPDGICVISTPAHQYLWDLNDDFSSHFRRYETDNLKEKFESAGFIIEKAYYWGFPLTLLWHTQIYNRLIKNKINRKVNYTKESFLSKCTKNELITKICSLPFYLDNLFNWTKRGGGIILIARKK